MGESRGAYGVLEGKPKGERPFGKLALQWEDNIKIVLQEAELGA